MSLVAVKNLFFHRKLVQNDQSSPARPFAGPLGWNSSSEQPLLANNDNRSEDPDSDIESQHTAVGTSDNPFANLHVGFGPIIRDFTIGLSDGLTVPFALTAGLSALGRTDVVIYGGIAEIIAGAISMGLGGWLGAKSELAEHMALREKVTELVVNRPEYIPDTIKDVFKPYNFPDELINNITSTLTTPDADNKPNNDRIINFVLSFKCDSSEPDASRAIQSAATIGFAYLLGGFLPLIPYFFVQKEEVLKALFISIGIMVLALFAFGYSKTCVFVGWKGGASITAGCVGGVEMVIVGGLAAAAAMGLVRLLSPEGA